MLEISLFVNGVGGGSDDDGSAAARGVDIGDSTIGGVGAATTGVGSGRSSGSIKVGID